MVDQPPGIDLEQVFLFIYRLLVGGGEEVTFAAVQATFFDIWVKVAFISTLITPILLAALAYVLIRYHQLRAEEEAAFKAKARLPHMETAEPKNLEWQRVLDLVSSERPSDWRVAIIEADVMLDALVSSKGYMGDNLGEKLKGIARGDFRALDQAWEAHKVRNELAHGGGDYILTQREAKRVVELYRQVFEEFDYI